SGKNYDCIVPVSGAKDSYFIVDLIKNKYGLNPLLVSYNKHYNTHVGNRNLAYLKTIFNCDIIELIVQPQKVKKITRVTLEKMGSIYWHILAGETVFPVQIAVKYKIPLIIWGVHQGLDQVGMFSHDDEVEMTRKYRKEHDLMGFEAEELLNDSNLTLDDIGQYIYPHDKEIEQVGVRGIYLGNFMPWDTKKQHEQMIKKFNYETHEQQRTFDTYNHIDCVHYAGLHDYIKFLKYGYGKVSDHASREIRWGRLNQEEALMLVKKDQNIKPSDLQLFLEWLEIDERSFFEFIDKFRDHRIWQREKDHSWKLRDSVLYHPSQCKDLHMDKIKTGEKFHFVQTVNKNPTLPEDSYTLIEKAYVTH
ncbi:MAG: N-acetyl sugar amidotransferase, partial [Campylobacterota bacterium]|nr:N-acetyl sugar amidotransferase [Campylobacterota bacterium]